MSRHSAALAQQLQWDLDRAHCRDQAAEWTRLEVGFLTAAPDETHQHLYAAQLICAGCPVLAACTQRAQLDGYTGLAAGTAFHNGRAAQTHPRPAAVPVTAPETASETGSSAGSRAASGVGPCTGSGAGSETAEPRRHPGSAAAS